MLQSQKSTTLETGGNAYQLYLYTAGILGRLESFLLTFYKYYIRILRKFQDLKILNFKIPTPIFPI